jgi:hypothetical protein
VVDVRRHGPQGQGIAVEIGNQSDAQGGDTSLILRKIVL